jgi:predicted double-glycine peptidase
MKHLIAALYGLSLLAGISAPSRALDIAGGESRPYSLPVTSLKEARYKTTMRQQYDFSCGSAAVATLLTHQYGYRISEQNAFEEMYALGDQAKIRREGFSLLDLKRFLAAHGFNADGFELPLDKLHEAGIPAIALITENGYNHFVVVKGLRDGRVLIGDPSVGTRVMPRQRFESLWSNRLLFVIHNKQNVAKFNHPADWRAAPLAPIAAGVNRESLGAAAISRFGPSDF